MPGRRLVRLGAFQLDPDTGELSRDGHKVRLPDRGGSMRASTKPGVRDN